MMKNVDRSELASLRAFKGMVDRGMIDPCVDFWMHQKPLKIIVASALRAKSALVPLDKAVENIGIAFMR